MDCRALLLGRFICNSAEKSKSACRLTSGIVIQNVRKCYRVLLCMHCALQWFSVCYLCVFMRRAFVWAQLLFLWVMKLSVWWPWEVLLLQYSLPPSLPLSHTLLFLSHPTFHALLHLCFGDCRCPHISANSWIDCKKLQLDAASPAKTHANSLYVLLWWDSYIVVLSCCASVYSKAHVSLCGVMVLKGLGMS